MRKIIARGVVDGRWRQRVALSFMTMYRHLYSHIDNLLRYNRRKWKPLIGCNGLAQCHRVLNYDNALCQSVLL